VALLAAVVVAAACSDFALEPDRVPTKLILEPADTLITQGDQAKMRVTVLDQDGEPFPVVPSWAPPRWTPSLPEAVTIAPNGDVQALGGGEVLVGAELAGLKAWTNLRINPSEVTLSAPVAYFIQAAQNLEGSVPIVAGRRALLRVFVTSDPGSFYQPRALVSFYLDGQEVHSVTLRPNSYLIPDVVEENRIDRSFNAVIPESVLQPGVEMVLELDVERVVPLAPGSQVRIPAEGRTALDVRAVPRMDLTVVPTLLASDPNESIFGWTDGLTSSSSGARFARSVLPIADLDLQVRDPYTTTADLTTESGWGAFLREIDVLRATDGAAGYYYGAVVLPSGSPYGGLGYLGRPASVGRPTESTLAHELGHNLDLRHAPCGGVSSFDGNYPHDGGSIGVWGYDPTGGSGLGGLKDPDQFKDLMGYCTPRWVSDYHFTKALVYRVEEEPFMAPKGGPEPVLLLWGSVDDGVLHLEPTFTLEAPPTLPAEDGPYRLDGVDTNGRPLFSLSFGLNEDSWGGGHFTFAVPLGADEAEALESVALTGPEGLVRIDRSTDSSPMALVTDRSTGRIRAILRDGVLPATLAADVAVVFSDGLPARGPGGVRE
jgi:hypothetical protein